MRDGNDQNGAQAWDTMRGDWEVDGIRVGHSDDIHSNKEEVEEDTIVDCEGDEEDKPEVQVSQHRVTEASSQQHRSRWLSSQENALGQKKILHPSIQV